MNNRKSQITIDLEELIFQGYSKKEITDIIDSKGFGKCIGNKNFEDQPRYTADIKEAYRLITFKH